MRFRPDKRDAVCADLAHSEKSKRMIDYCTLTFYLIVGATGALTALIV